MKAITPVIATVMLMLITVGTVSMSYAWFSNMMATQTEKNIAIPVGGVQCYSNRISVIVTNAGANSNITDDDIIVADINGVSVRNTPFFGGFNTNGLVGYWRFEQSNGSAATNDSSGYGNMGTLMSMSLTGTATSGPTLGGRFGNALVFDGVNDYVSLGNPSSLLIPNTVTIEGWIYLAGEPATVNAWFGNGYADADSLFIGTHSGVPSYWWARIATTEWAFGTKLFNQWVHLAITLDLNLGSGQLKGYQNGVLVKQTDWTSDIMMRSATKTLGYGSTTGYWNGNLDEVRIWRRSLSADEIKQLNKTNAGNFTLAPNSAVTLIKGYPVFAKGRYTVRVGTRNGIIERQTDCL